MRHPRQLVHAIALLAVLSPLALSMPADASGTPSAGAWAITSTTPPIATGWSSLTCPTPTDCLGLAYTGPGSSVLEQSTNGGASFTYMAAPQASNASRIACANVHFCVLAGVDNGPGYPASTSVTTNAGKTWKVLALPGDAGTTTYEVSVGCTSSTCYLATTANGPPLFLSVTDTSTSWATVTLPTTPDAAGTLSGVSCGAGRCVAVGSTEDYAQGLIFESDNAGAWSEVLPPVGSFTIASVATVGCGAYACAAYGWAAGDEQGSLLTSTSPGVWTAYSTGLGFETPRSISCSTTRCVAVGGNWDFGGLAAWTLTGVTPTWTSITTLPTGEGGQVFESSACAATACLAGANRLYELGNTDNTWVTAKSLNGMSGYEYLSCPTTTTCVAAGSLGDGRTASESTHDGGLIWSHLAAAGAFQSFSYGLSCVKATCMMDGYDEVSVTGWLERSTNGGSSWTHETEPTYGAFNFFHAISCATATTCVAGVGWGLGAFARTTDGGAHWTQVNTTQIGEKGSIISLQCMSATLCLGIAATGTGVQRLVSRNGGESWSYGTVTADVFDNASLSCVATGVCLLTGLLASGRPVSMRSIDGGLHWTSIGSPPDQFGRTTDSLSAACSSATTCELAYGGAANSRLFATSDAGRKWTPVRFPLGVAYLELNCTTAQCVATGEQSGVQTVTLRQALS